MKNYLRTLRGFNREVRLYLFADALSGFTVDGGVYAVLFNLYLLRLGYQPAFIGGVNAAGLLAYGMFSLPAGWFGARWGNRRMIVFGLSAMAAGGLALPFAEFFAPNLRAVWLIAAYVVTYCGLALHVTNATPFLAEITGARERAQLFSLVSAFWFLAGFAGNLVGGGLPNFFTFASAPAVPGIDSAVPYRYSLWLTAFLLIPASLAMRAARGNRIDRVTEPAPPVSQPHTERPQSAPADSGSSTKSGQIGQIGQSGQSGQIGRISLLALVRFLLVMGVGAVLIFLNMYLDRGLGNGTAGIGMLLGAGRLCAAATALSLPALAARWSKATLIVATAGGTALSMAPLILLPAWGAAAISFIGVVSLMSIRIPIFLVYTMEAVGPARRGLMSGAGEMANGLGFALIGLSGGYLIGELGYRPLFLLGASLTAAGTFIFFKYCRKTPELSDALAPS